MIQLHYGVQEMNYCAARKDMRHGAHRNCDVFINRNKIKHHFFIPRQV